MYIRNITIKQLYAFIVPYQLGTKAHDAIALRRDLAARVHNNHALALGESSYAVEVPFII
jgi:hypothetical protein